MEKIKPVVKWVGGKGQLLDIIIPLFPKYSGVYYEPFIGSGSVLLCHQPLKAVINDKNTMLINVYKVIQNKNSKNILIDYLEKLREKYRKSSNHKDFFIFVKNSYNEHKMKKLKTPDPFLASLFIFLNKTCFNARMNENKNGILNCSYNKDIKTSIFDVKRIEDLHKYLNTGNKKIYNQDYEQILKNAKKGDFVFLDPPYFPYKKESYVYEGFDMNDHQKIIDTFIQLDKRGVKVMMTNSNTSFIKDNLKKYTQIPIKANRNISVDKKTRKDLGYNEIIIINYKTSDIF